MAIKTRGQLARDDSNFPVGFNYVYFSNATSANVKAAPGFLHGIVTSSSMGNVVLYDNAAATASTTIANLTITGTLTQLTDLNITLTNGLYATMSTLGNITFIYV